MGAICRALVIGRAPCGTYHRRVTTSTSLSNIAPLATQPYPDARTSRFAPLATPQFDEWFGSELTAMAGEVAAAVGGTFRGLVLGGGYGRGEGGIVVRHGQRLIARGTCGNEFPVSGPGAFVLVPRSR